MMDEVECDVAIVGGGPAGCRSRKPQVEEEVIAVVGTGRGRRGLLLEAFIRQLARMDEPAS